MVNSTTSAEKMEEIAKSGWKYQAAILSHVTVITSRVKALCQATSNGWKSAEDYYNEDIRKGEEQRANLLKGINVDPTSYGSLKKATEEGNKLTEDQKEAASYFMGKLVNGNKDLRAAILRPNKDQQAIYDAIEENKKVGLSQKDLLDKVKRTLKDQSITLEDLKVAEEYKPMTVPTIPGGEAGTGGTTNITSNYHFLSADENTASARSVRTAAQATNQNNYRAWAANPQAK